MAKGRDAEAEAAADKDRRELSQLRRKLLEQRTATTRLRKNAAQMQRAMTKLQREKETQVPSLRACRVPCLRM